jgi:hypothetical protein
MRPFLILNSFGIFYTVFTVQQRINDKYLNYNKLAIDFTVHTPGAVKLKFTFGPDIATANEAVAVFPISVVVTSVYRTVLPLHTLITCPALALEPDAIV